MAPSAQAGGVAFAIREHSPESQTPSSARVEVYLSSGSIQARPAPVQPVLQDEGRSVKASDLQFASDGGLAADLWPK